MLNNIYKKLKELVPPSGSLILKYEGLQNYDSVLDIGCGKTSVLEVFGNKYKVGIDAFEEYISISKSKKTHNSYIQGNINEIDLEKILPDFEAVIIFDLIEHLTVKEAENLINTIESFSNIKFIAIKTPSSYIDQDTYDNNVYQIHKSHIKFEYFKNKGYKIYGCDGPRFLYVEGNKMKDTISVFRGILSFILRPFYTFLPDSSLNYLAILKR